MMKQYLAIKKTQPNAMLFYRMGDFYELFLSDAEKAAPLLDITLTTRDKGKSDPVPMCGVPVHSADGYIKKLAELGHRVAICEQVEAAAGGKGLVRREVVEVITPGLVGDPAGLESRSEVAVLAIVGPPANEDWGLASLEVSTGDFRTTRVTGSGEQAEGLLLEEIQRVAPREILLREQERECYGDRLAERLPGVALTVVAAEMFDSASAPVCPDGFDPDSTAAEMRAAAAVLSYLGRNQPAALSHAPRLRPYRLGESMVLDAATRAHLELFENAEDRGRQHTLIDLLDRASTPLGSRRLSRWLRYPLVDPVRIAGRQDAVAYLADRDRMRGRVREKLKPVRDLERLLARAIRQNASPRDLGALRDSLAALLPVADELLSLGAASGEPSQTGSPLPEALRVPEPLESLVERLQEGLVDDPPVIPRGSRGVNETGYIRQGFRPELDELRESARRGREWIAELEQNEREATGITTLKVRFHPVHGYSLEIPKTQLARVPDTYERKQTLASVERFTNTELLKIEGDVMGAHERAAGLEREIFESLRLEALARVFEVRAAADATGDLDALASLAEVGRKQGWARPDVHADEGLEIRSGRHPVVEQTLLGRGTDDFVPNDCDLEPERIQMLLITGPNMSGKSTYLRQVAVISLLAQMGSWVPAERARIGVIDRIFTRVGASDRLARGESTFMVEMRETAEILSHASRRSLVILDEIGRGTSTYDGLAIAWAVAEYLHDTPGLSPRTLFATHYHELTDLANVKARVRNAHFEAREWGEEVVFLRRLVAGGASRSYGIQVARLAGLPSGVIDRAREILQSLESDAARGVSGGHRHSGGEESAQLPFSLEPLPQPHRAAEEEVLRELGSVKPEETTPLEALALLARLAKRLSQTEET